MLLDPPPPLDSLPPSSCELGDVVLEGRPGQTVCVRNGAITEVRATRGGDDRTYAGSVVMPGLIDSHQHLPPATPLRLTGLFCLLNLLHGVTSVLEAGDSDGMAVAVARQLTINGLLPGPRIVSVGPYIARPPRAWPNTVLVHDPLQPDVVVQEAIDRGAQMIKLYEGLTRTDIHAISSAAAARGLRAIGHVPAGINVEDSAVPEVQHLLGVPTAESQGCAEGLLRRFGDWHAVDEARLEHVVEASVEKKIRHTPTMVVFEGILRARERASAAPLVPRMYPELIWDPEKGISNYRNAPPGDIARLRDSLAVKLELVRRLHQAGVELYVGTDTPQPFVVAGASVHREIQIFAEAGIPAPAAMHMATAAAASRLGVPGLGTIAPGAPADLLVLGRDPSQDVTALESIRAVVSGGRLLAVGALRAAVERQLRHYRRPLIDRLSMIGARRALKAIQLRT